METDTITEAITDTRTIFDLEKQDEILLDALKLALCSANDHRLFRWGKLAGLFPSRTGASGAAATFAVKTGLLETVRTENRGKLVVEWVRAMPKAVEYVHERDSPKAVLRELQSVIGETRDGVPVWMSMARDETAQLALRFEHHSRDMMKRLDGLAERVEAAIRRAEAAVPVMGETIASSVPWGVTALEYLDRRKSGGGAGWCRLSELFHALREQIAGLSVTGFHDGIRRLYEAKAIRLSPPADPETVREPEYAVVIGGIAMWVVGR